MSEPHGPSQAPRTCEPTRASALIVNDAGEYLLHLRDQRPGIWEPGSWSLLGGAREPGDPSLHDTIRRELREEAGLALPTLEPYSVEAVHDDDGVDGPVGEPVAIQIFAGRWNGDPAALPLTEGIMLHWFDPQVIPRLRLGSTTLSLIQRHARQQDTGRHGQAPARRGEPAPNVVGVHLYLENDDGRILLGLRHPDSAYAGGMHHFLAGHCERESAIACLVREADEEAGLLIDPADARLAHVVHLVDAPGAQPRLQLVFGVRRRQGDPELREPDKCLSWGWWNPNDLPARTVPYTRAAIEGIHAGRLYTEMGWP